MFYVCLFPSDYGEILASVIASQLYKIPRKFDKHVVKIKMKAEFEDTHSLRKRATILLAHIHFNAVTTNVQSFTVTSHWLECEHVGRHCGWIVSRLIWHMIFV